VGRTRKRIFAAVVAIVFAYGCAGADRPPAGNEATATGDNIFSGPCSPEGAVRDCHAVIGIHHGVVDCFTATQTCSGGVWTGCGGDGTGGTIAAHSFGGGLHADSLSAASSTGSPCSTDPCDIGCSGYNETPPTPLFPPCGAGGFLIGDRVVDDLHGPIHDSQPDHCIADQNGCVAQRTINDNRTKCDDCQFDSHCVAGECEPWLLDGAATSLPADCASPNRVDFTVEYPCVTPSFGPPNDFHVTVCNRGLDDASAGTLRIGVFDPDKVPNCMGPTGPRGALPRGGRELRVDLTDAVIAAGSCFEVNASNADVTDLLGNIRPVNEFLAQLGDGVGLAANWDASIPECNVCNNWSGYDRHVRCTTVGTTTATVAQTYDGVCPPGYTPQWGTLAYSVNTPPGTDVKFAVSTGPAAAGPWTPGVPAQVAEAAPTPPPADHPSNCSMTGPSPCGGPYGPSCRCPIDLFPALTTPAPLTDANANQEFLELSIGFDATTFGCFASVPTTSTGTSAGCSGGQDVTGGACSAATQYSSQVCQQDFHCNGASCVWNQPPASPPGWFDPNCKTAAGAPGVDLTVGYPCGSTVPMCNRGGGTLASGTTVAFNISNSGTSWTCNAPFPTTAPGVPDCTYTTTAPLGPGQCVSVSGCDFGHGQRRIYVNADLAVTECTSASAGSYDGCINNTTAIKATGHSCPPRCQPPASVTQPSVNSWQVVYSCVGNE
jgi:hypothetical protein